MAMPTSPKTLERQRIRIFKDGLVWAWIQRGNPFTDKSGVSPKTYVSMRGSNANRDSDGSRYDSGNVFR